VIQLTQPFGCERGNSLPGDDMKMTEQQGERPIKVLNTKIGFDGHDRGSRIVTVFQRDAGVEVVYSAPGLGDDVQVIKAGINVDYRHPGGQQERQPFVTKYRASA
jgi:hypothetical protein